MNKVWKEGEKCRASVFFPSDKKLEQRVDISRFLIMKQPAVPLFWRFKRGAYIALDGMCVTGGRGTVSDPYSSDGLMWYGRIKAVNKDGTKVKSYSIQLECASEGDLIVVRGISDCSSLCLKLILMISMRTLTVSVFP